MLNGESIVNQKEGLYLCKKFDIHVVGEQTRIKKRNNRQKAVKAV